MQPYRESRSHTTPHNTTTITTTTKIIIITTTATTTNIITITTIIIIYHRHLRLCFDVASLCGAASLRFSLSWSLVRHVASRPFAYFYLTTQTISFYRLELRVPTV